MENEKQEKKSLKTKISEKKQKVKNTIENLQILLSILGAIFFVITTISNTKKDYGDSNIYKYILIITIAYVLIFIIYVLLHSRNRKQLSSDTKKFRNNFGIIKLLLNVLFIGASVLIFIDSIQDFKDLNLINLAKTGFSFLLLLFKLILTISKLRKRVKGQIKSVRKEKELKEKEKQKALKENQDE